MLTPAKPKPNRMRQPMPPPDRIYKSDLLVMSYKQAKVLYNKKCLTVDLWKLSKAVGKFKTDLSKTFFVKKIIIPILNYLS